MECDDGSWVVLRGEFGESQEEISYCVDGLYDEFKGYRFSVWAWQCRDVEDVARDDHNCCLRRHSILVYHSREENQV